VLTVAIPGQRRPPAVRAGSWSAVRQPCFISGNREDMVAGELEAPPCTLILR